MMSASEGGGGHVKADVVREVASILYYKSVINADKGRRGSKNFQNFTDNISVSSLSTVNEREDISNSAVAKLTTKERHKYTQSSGDGGADGWLPLGLLAAREEEEEEAMDGK